MVPAFVGDPWGFPLPARLGNLYLTSHFLPECHEESVVNSSTQMGLEKSGVFTMSATRRWQAWAERERDRERASEVFEGVECPVWKKQVRRLEQ